MLDFIKGTFTITWFAGLSVFSWRTFLLLLFVDIFPHPSTAWVALFLSKIFIFHCWYNTIHLSYSYYSENFYQYLDCEEVFYDWLITLKTLPVVALNLSCENNKVISKIKFSFYCFILYWFLNIILGVEICLVLLGIS